MSESSATADSPAFDYEQILLRGALSDEERDALIVRVVEGASLTEAAVELSIPPMLALKLVDDERATDELLEMIRNAQRVSYVSAVHKRLADIALVGDPKTSVDAAKLLSQTLGLYSSSTAPQAKKAKPRRVSKAQAKSLEQAVRQAEAGSPS